MEFTEAGFLPWDFVCSVVLSGVDRDADDVGAKKKQAG
tara:strand:+ start:13940 stop:14053 length:114 start_codon:yes stop_codon:yes gene_type:complete